MRTDPELTVRQAADLLNVSRTYLIGLLEAGDIEHTGVGERCTIRAASLFEYKHRDDQHRREAAAALSALTQEWA